MRYFYFSIYMYVVPIPALFLIRVYCIVYTNGVHAVFVDQIEINFLSWRKWGFEMSFFPLHNCKLISYFKFNRTGYLDEGHQGNSQQWGGAGGVVTLLRARKIGYSRDKQAQDSPSTSLWRFKQTSDV